MWKHRQVLGSRNCVCMCVCVHTCMHMYPHVHKHVSLRKWSQYDHLWAIHLASLSPFLPVPLASPSLLYQMQAWFQLPERAIMLSLPDCQFQLPSLIPRLSFPICFLQKNLILSSSASISIGLVQSFSIPVQRAVSYLLLQKGKQVSSSLPWES